ncbi:MAG: energy transducer TonB [Silvibacterium sp.]|nr:energy transducer TonB [Silvibacterium sp.]
MGNQLLTPPELEPESLPTRPAEKEPDFLLETGGSMWSSLISNLRDAFSPSKQPPLQLSSKPVAVEDLEVEESVWKSLAASIHDVFFPKKLPPLDLTSKPIEVEDPTQTEPVWKTLGTSIHDLFFPKKLPPLELTSKPVAVVDPMAVKRNPKSTALAIAAHVFVIGLIALFLIAGWRTRAIQRKQKLADVDIKPFIPLTMKMNQSMGGGGGGGAHDLVEASKGKLPKMAKTQITPPQIIKNDNPKLAVEPTIVMPQQVKLPDANMPNVGVPQSPQVALASQGPGSGSGFGTGRGGGIGSGNGNGVGPGEGGGYGGGLMRPGGGVSAPQVIYSVDPEFSDEARRAKYQGICVVSVIVDAQGNPRNVRVVRPLGMGLDEKAVEAVRQYKFKPAYYQGHPVPVEVNIEVNFRIY